MAPSRSYFLLIFGYDQYSKKSRGYISQMFDNAQNSLEPDSSDYERLRYIGDEIGTIW